MIEFMHVLTDRITGTNRRAITHTMAYPFSNPPTEKEVYTVTRNIAAEQRADFEQGAAFVTRLALAKANARGLHSRPDTTAPILIGQGMYGSLLIAAETRNHEELQNLLNNIAQVPDYDGILARMVKALAWYGDAAQNYTHTDSTTKPTQVMKDCGKRARDALAYAGITA